jgi:uncharacterized phage protein (TIGR01671 family)
MKNKRIIKFRAWIADEDGNGKMFNLPFSDGEHIKGLNENGTIEVCRHNNYILMQFTGFKDIKDKEIYEGDILTDEFNRTLLVEWFGVGFTLRALYPTNFDRANPMFWFNDINALPEIIGNIYETPELLQTCTEVIKQATTLQYHNADEINIKMNKRMADDVLSFVKQIITDAQLELEKTNPEDKLTIAVWKNGLNFWNDVKDAITYAQNVNCLYDSASL